MAIRGKKAIAIVKINEKEIFLDMKNAQNKMTVDGIDGINVKKVNNVAVIVDMGPDAMPAVFMRTGEKRTLYTGKSVF
jgi:hypothetical protein